MVVGQQLGVVFALLDDRRGARDWLVKSYADATENVRAQVAALQQVIETQLPSAERVRPAERLRSSVLSGKGLAGEALLAYGTGTVPLLVAAAVAPSYRERLIRKKAEQKAAKAEIIGDRVAGRRQPIRDLVQIQLAAIRELQRDADATRSACLALGAFGAPVRRQVVVADESSRGLSLYVAVVA